MRYSGLESTRESSHVLGEVLAPRSRHRNWQCSVSCMVQLIAEVPSIGSVGAN